MDDVTKGLLIGGFFSILTVLVPALLNWRKAHAEVKKLEAETDSANVVTIAGLAKEVQAMSERMTYLENELRRYVNAYARAIRFIRDNLPSENIPDFLLDSNRKITK